MVSVYSNGYSCLCITFFIYLRAYVFDIRYDNVLVCANTKKIICISTIIIMVFMNLRRYRRWKRKMRIQNVVKVREKSDRNSRRILHCTDDEITDSTLSDEREKNG